MWVPEFLDLLEGYIVRWGYDKILLNRFRGIKRVDLQGTIPEGFGKYVYYNTQKHRENRTYNKADCLKPELGKSYVVCRENKYNINFQRTPADIKRRRLFDWYENVIPAQLKRFGLRYEKIKIISHKKSKPLTGHAWKIIGGLEEFAARPIIIF